MTISGSAKLAAVMGWPIAHSLSPALHNYWINELGLDAAYAPLAVAPENFRAAFDAAPLLGFRGLNVTIPFKAAAYAACATRDPAAEAIGAVNTVVFDEGGAAHGSNTDGAGFMAALRAGAPGLRVEGGPAVVFGAGGAAQAIVWALIEEGAPEIRIVNRSADKAEALAARHPAANIRIDPVENSSAAIGGARIIVNATSRGMGGAPDLDVDMSRAAPGAAVMDIVYRPLETGFLRNARACGLVAIDGLGMLIEQARPGFRAWFGAEPPAGDGARERLLRLLQAEAK
ncbi:MAG: shikimate dehydrogenase [Parvularculaceae bacterium]